MDQKEKIKQAVKEESDVILGKSLENLKELVIEFAGTGNNILFAGDRGVGKELFANLYCAAAGGRTICPINMTGIPSELIDSILFGYVKGAFTGAKADGADGLITEKNASKLCFFFDELGDIPINSQAKLLRFVQFGEIQKVGASKAIAINDYKQLRIVAASNKPECIRDDLKDRFKCLRIPSLVERRHDIPLLLKHFTKGKGVTGITEYTLKGLYEIEINSDYEWSYIYPWKGNIRELVRVIEDAIFLCKKRNDVTLKSEDFPAISWSHNILEPGEQEMNELIDPSWMTPPILRMYKRQYGSSEPYEDESDTVKFTDLKNKSKPLPYHYFIKSLPGEVSKEARLIEEIRHLRHGVNNNSKTLSSIITDMGKTLSSVKDKIPTPEPPQEDQITYDNTSPKLFDEQFYNYQACQNRTVKQIIKKYNLSEGTVKKKHTEARKRINNESN